MDIFLGVLFLIVCILLIAVILLQRGRGGGLGAAFGGGAGSSAFGTRTGDVFTWVTIILTAAFLLLAIGTVLAHQQEPGRVATPEFSPAPGEIEESVNVTIRTSTPGAEIWYTLDGGDPEKGESMPYEKDPVLVEPGTTLKARAYRAGWRESEVATGVYLVPEPEEDTDTPSPQSGDSEDQPDASEPVEPQTEGDEETPTQPVGAEAPVQADES